MGGQTGKLRKRAKRKRQRQKCCDRCGHLNSPGARECKQCGSERFAPLWVRRLGKVNRNFYVQATEPPDVAETTTERVTLYKWWPGDNATFNINTAEQWEAIKKIVDEDLAPYLKWKRKAEIASEIETRIKEGKSADKHVKSLAKQDPSFFPRLLKGIKLDRVTGDDYEQIKDALTEVAAVYLNADESLRKSIRRIIAKLPGQGKQAIEGLSDLMETLTLQQITAVTNEVKRRVGLLQTFRERILDERTYEIKGDGSIHRLLEQAMWIIDDRYWLMHSNNTLRKIIGDQLAKKDRRFEKKRPDFVCGAVDKKLIVIEIKRPSHTLKVDDLNQLERYVVVAQKYDSEASNFDAMLVGQKGSDDLRRVLRMRGSRFSMRTYTQLIGDTERRYREYLKVLEPS